MTPCSLNHALRDIPPERVRLHLCWGNYEGPHHRDVELRDIIDIVLMARAARIPRLVELVQARGGPAHSGTHQFLIF